MKMILLLSALCATMLGCETSAEKAMSKQNELVSRLFYFEDPRTRICYSYLGPKDAKLPGSHSVVPCEKARDLLPSPEDVPPAPTNFEADDIPEDGVLAQR